MSAIASGQRVRLEVLATKTVYETLGAPVPTWVNSWLADDQKQQIADAKAAVATFGGGAVKRSKPSQQQQQQADIPTTTGKYAALEKALRLFFEKLPSNHGAQLCIDDLLSYIRHQNKFNNPKSDTLSATLKYLAEPGFCENLAAFGKLPNHPYVLVFDPYAYQQRPPPSLEESRKLDPLAFEESAKGGSNIMMPSKAELEALDKDLEQIFAEKLPASKLKCPKCAESKFMHFHEEQRRSADEGSSYVFFCANCGYQGRSR